MKSLFIILALTTLAHSHQALAKEVVSLNYAGEEVVVFGDMSPLTDVEGIKINNISLSYNSDTYYIAGDVYSKETRKAICDALGFKYSKPENTGAWFYQYGLYLELGSIRTESLSGRGYAQALYCTSEHFE